MSVAISSPPIPATLADLLDQLGGVAPERIRMHPLPGTATVDDVVAIERCENRLCELVDGVLVQKVMGYGESGIASLLIIAIGKFIAKDDLGVVTGADGMFRLPDNLVRIPDVAYIAWEHLPNEEIPNDPVPKIVPDLAVEVLSVGNTPAEMARKLREYFRAGVQLVWFIDPKSKTATVYTSARRSKIVESDGVLDGGKVLPGFELPLADLFVRRRRAGGGKARKNGR